MCDDEKTMLNPSNGMSVEEATDFAVKKAAILFIAYIMEDESINCDEARIAEVFEGISRYSQAIDDHLITLDKVSDIIQELTGIDIRWGKK